MIYENYLKWKEDPFFDEKTRAEVAALDDDKEIEDRFRCGLTFGTGGLRGKLGAGTNRMNFYTVGRATQGLADYVAMQGKKGSVVIAYDSRKMSPEFALDSACVLAANGIEVYLFESLRPTPELSYAVRRLGACVGVMITASHNPAEYNGYKVYDSGGGQIVPPMDGEIISCVERTSFEQVKRISRGEAEKRGLLHIVGKEIDDGYLSAIEALCFSDAGADKEKKKLKIVYTPLHGTGNLPVRRILSELGFENVYVVPEQETPDGAFPTVERPNPEDPKAFDLALQLAAEKDADLVLATDPDADRLGVYVRERRGEYHALTGNMSGLLLAEYVLSRREALGLLPKDRSKGALVTTIVSSKMAARVAEHYGLQFIETLTGFKYIGEQIKLFEADGKIFEFGFEESYGYLAGAYVRDKDAVAASALLCDAAAFYAGKGMSLWDAMCALYEKYGYFKESMIDITYSGADGALRIKQMMEELRKRPPEELGGMRVRAVRDYAKGERTELTAGVREKLSLPASEVLYFELEGGWCCARPSGTEEKIKFYFGAEGNSLSDAEAKAMRIGSELISLVGAFCEDVA